MDNFVNIDGIRININKEITRKIKKILQSSYTPFQRALEKTFSWEGGWTDDVNDSGGATKYGISLNFLKMSNIDINDDGIIDRKDIIDVDKEEAETLYKIHFWKPLKCDCINSFLIQRQLFDTGVNAGNRRAIKILQKCLNSLGESLTVDGLIGNKTITSLDKKDYKVLNNYMVDERMKFFRGLVEKYPKNSKFLNGWLNRAKDFYV